MTGFFAGLLVGLFVGGVIAALSVAVIAAGSMREPRVDRFADLDEEHDRLGSPDAARASR